MPMGAPDDRNLGQNGTHGLHLGQNGTHPRGMHSLQAQDIHDSPSFSNQQQQQQQQEEGANNKSRRNPRQQQQNKAAQQRYRCRHDPSLIRHTCPALCWACSRLSCAKSLHDSLTLG